MSDYELRLPAWRRRLEGEKAAKRYVAEHTFTWAPVEVPGVLPPVGHTGVFMRRFWDPTPNQFAWLNDDLPTAPLLPRMPPFISGEANVPTTSSHPPGTAGGTATFHFMRRRRH